MKAVLRDSIAAGAQVLVALRRPVSTDHVDLTVRFPDSGQKVVAQTTAGETTTCSVTLASPPTPGNATVDATIEPVPGEHHTANNTLSFPVTFQ